MVSTLVWSSRLVWRWARPSPQHRMMRARCTSRCGDVRFRITASSRFRSPARSRSGGAGATGMMEPPCSHCCHSYSIYQSSAQPRRSARIVVLFMKRGTRATCNLGDRTSVGDTWGVQRFSLLCSEPRASALAISRHLMRCECPWIRHTESGNPPRLILRGNRERPRAGGGWSKIAAVERPHRCESRRRRPFRLNREFRLGTMAV